MREIIIQSWCDECAANDVHTPGEPIDITWQGNEISLDLCLEHAEPIRKTVELIENYGIPVKRSKKRKQPQPSEQPQPQTGERKPRPSDVYRTEDGLYACPSCDRILPNAQGLGAHRSKAHGYRLNP